VELDLILIPELSSNPHTVHHKNQSTNLLQENFYVETNTINQNKLIYETSAVVPSTEILQ
jgi:hypothetical protein